MMNSIKSSSKLLQSVMLQDANYLYGENRNYKEKMCHEGKLQSPIDIKEPMTYAENLELNVEKIINSLSTNRPLTLSKGLFRVDGIMGTVTTRDPILFHEKKLDIDLTFQCDKLEFHSPSEHKLYGKRMDVEMQLTCELLPSSHNSKYRNKELIISFLFKGDNKLNMSIDPIGMLKGFNFEALDFVKHEFFQKMVKTDKFIMYEGSLSQPPCNENVLHIVSHYVYKIPQIEVERIRDQLSASFRLQHGNARPIQPLNDRPIIRNFAAAEKPKFVTKPMSFN